MSRRFPRLRRLLRWLLAAVRLTALLTTLALVAGAWWLHARVIPAVDVELTALRDYRPPTRVRVLDRHGAEFDSFHVVRREWVPLEEIPAAVQLAVIAAEDRRFRRHAGVDLRGIARAAIANLRAGEVVEGGSTLTQQLVKNLVVGNERSLQRKAREALLAWRLEQQLSKDQVLELYLNYIYLGSGNYGVEAAAWDYFGVSVRELDAGQAALLAGLIPAPSRTSPRRSPEIALERRDVVLAAMVAEGYLSAEVAAAFGERGIDPPLRTGHEQGVAVAYRTEVRREVRRLLGGEIPYDHGLQVHTPFDPTVQRAAERAIRDAAAAVEQRQAALPDAVEGPVQGAAVVLDNVTGGVVALVGGVDMELEGFDRATQARRQPGSSFKPFVYAAALEGGRTQLDTVLDAPLSLSAGAGRRWNPRNYGGGYRGRMPMHRALALSVNTVSVRLAMETTPAAVADLAGRLGVSTPLRTDLTLALGSSEVTVLEQATAYAALARMGRAGEPVFIERLIDLRATEVGVAGGAAVVDGQVVAQLPGVGAQAVDPAVAYQVIDMLRQGVANGTGRRAYREGLDRAGKTGTTTGFADAWFVGCTPAYTIAVWIGRDDRRPLGDGETGGRAALPAWVDIADALDALDPAAGSRFPVPDEVLLIDDGGRWAGVPRSAVPDGALPRIALEVDEPLPVFPGTG